MTYHPCTPTSSLTRGGNTCLLCWKHEDPGTPGAVCPRTGDGLRPLFLPRPPSHGFLYWREDKATWQHNFCSLTLTVELPQAEWGSRWGQLEHAGRGGRVPRPSPRRHAAAAPEAAPAVCLPWASFQASLRTGAPAVLSDWPLSSRPASRV